MLPRPMADPAVTRTKAQRLDQWLRTTAVGSYQPNAWGLYDMHGNAYEWCWDWYGPYPAGSVTDPLGLSSGYNAHVTRGGAWYCAGEWYCGGGRCRDRQLQMYPMRGVCPSLPC